MELSPLDEAPPGTPNRKIRQASNTSVNHSTIVPKPVPSLAQAKRSRSGEGDPLAQASPFSPRRGLEEWDSSFGDLSLRRVPSRLSEITLAQKCKLVA
ncbi:hypothetical protein DEO72_LG3g2968 [Vigna unguiculata]|uniref:Uncharacterized protein n=1 Tax=Vigna unguiculata TaxID=3917 RepID=A0A4D6LIL4_VIGUN|nr:hypothetical protein DEO72_LG3g2968 [Vigna unguiculata]